jgi:transcriptional regulator with XRE-family HTH domain
LLNLYEIIRAELRIVNNICAVFREFLQATIMSINTRIKIIREDNNLTQSEFAEKLEMSVRTVQIWENDKIPPAKGIKKICKTFNINKEWLEHGTGEMKAASHSQSINAGRDAVGNTQISNGSYSATPQQYDADVTEIAALIQQYASPAFRANLKERLLKMKSDSKI